MRSTVRVRKAQKVSTCAKWLSRARWGSAFALIRLRSPRHPPTDHPTRPAWGGSRFLRGWVTMHLMNFGPSAWLSSLPGTPGNLIVRQAGCQRPQGGERAGCREPLIPQGPCADGVPEARINVNRPAVVCRFATGSPVGRRVATEGALRTSVRSCKGAIGHRSEGALV